MEYSLLKDIIVFLILKVLGDVVDCVPLFLY